MDALGLVCCPFLKAACQGNVTGGTLGCVHLAAGAYQTAAYPESLQSKSCSPRSGYQSSQNTIQWSGYRTLYNLITKGAFSCANNTY